MSLTPSSDLPTTNRLGGKSLNGKPSDKDVLLFNEASNSWCFVPADQVGQLQTPWLQDINGNEKTLDNTKSITVEGTSSVTPVSELKSKVPISSPNSLLGTFRSLSPDQNTTIQEYMRTEIFAIQTQTAKINGRMDINLIKLGNLQPYLRLGNLDDSDLLHGLKILINNGTLDVNNCQILNIGSGTFSTPPFVPQPFSNIAKLLIEQGGNVFKINMEDLRGAIIGGSCGQEREFNTHNEEFLDPFNPTLSFASNIDNRKGILPRTGRIKRFSIFITVNTSTGTPAKIQIFLAGNLIPSLEIEMPLSTIAVPVGPFNFNLPAFGIGAGETISYRFDVSSGGNVKFNAYSMEIS